MARIVTWYDRQSRNWITQTLDKVGNQIGNAEFSYKKPPGVRRRKKGT